MKTPRYFSLILLPILFLFQGIPSSLPLSNTTKIVDFEAITPLNNAHSHNDYWKEHPLWDALQHGFTSIEIDVHLVKNELVVAHLLPTFTKQSTLQELYLQPLFELYQLHAPKILPQYEQPLQIMIDIKTEGVTTYLHLEKILAAYEEMLTVYTKNSIQPKAISVIISGNRPIELIASKEKRLVAIDGRLADLGKGYAATLMPMISDRFSKITHRHLLRLPYTQQNIHRLQYYARIAKQEGKTLRFWQTPEDEYTWQTLLNAGVDWINTDEIARLTSFLQSPLVLVDAM